MDSWLDENAVAMTGLDMSWDDYWHAVQADAVNFPGCKDFCKLVSENGVPIAVICYGCYEGIATISELLVSPACRGKGVGTRILRELIANCDAWLGERPKRITAVVFPENLASQRAFLKAGFVLDHSNEDPAALHYVCALS